ncbi:IS1595 family transposase [Spiroplasma ixodetis]|uniref:IS1595 family transposase n=1 Tax=Spiroplasma ixodetis TaxID=2141 RepID=UPI002576A31B|nr:IS1595 family transposase [Spiroplasma ixodetis]
MIKSFNKIIINYLEKIGINNKNIFSFLFNLYEQLMINSNFKKVYVFFLFHSLIFQGIQFNFTNCINCNQITNLYLINYDLGGVFCKNCSLKLAIINFDIVLFKKIYQLYLLNYQDINKWKVEKEELNKILNILENHCKKYNNKLITDFSPHVLVEETMKLNEFNNAFQTEQDCLKYIASLKKNKCIMCSWTSLNTSNLRRIRCLKCHQTFSILHGTIFYKSQTPLRFWFYLIFRWINTKHGITSTDVAKELGVTLKNAWRMDHEIRNRIAKQEHQFIVEGIVKMDEMYLSHMGFKKQGRSLINKTLIVGIYEKTTNNLIVKVIKNAKSKNLLQFARNHISSKCDVHTDSWKGYRDFKSLFLNHKTVNHQDGYVSKIGVNTNQIESVWKHIRRTFKTHIKVAKHHVHLYAKEAAYKFNKIPTFETVMLCFI